MCTIRNKSVQCKAAVTQMGEVFTMGQHQHCHPCDPGATLKAEVTAKVKSEAKRDAFRPALQIAEEVIQGHSESSGPVLPRLHNLQRIANRVRAVDRPRHPTTLDFQVTNNLIMV